MDVTHHNNLICSSLLVSHCHDDLMIFLPDFLTCPAHDAHRSVRRTRGGHGQALLPQVYGRVHS